MHPSFFIFGTLLMSTRGSVITCVPAVQQFHSSCLSCTPRDLKFKSLIMFAIDLFFHSHSPTFSSPLLEADALFSASLMLVPFRLTIMPSFLLCLFLYLQGCLTFSLWRPTTTVLGSLTGVPYGWIQVKLSPTFRSSTNHNVRRVTNRVTTKSSDCMLTLNNLLLSI